ncbi:24679_t:CDS:2 [Dentiscutata erythropus]|uniref:24679_t:CDS:1 n=1 Tax=Dentiscutata erythropus TaxID=1348616 RepID=A0A9N9FAQ8_9GLOM|nr:24679_t:CDS:2 [Dentiscutata erythropus]
MNFFTIHNPNTVRSYGFKPANYQVSGEFSLFMHLDQDPKDSGIVAWFAADNSWQLMHYLGNGIAIFAPHSVGLHPDINGRFAVARFTALLNGNYTLSHVNNTYNTLSSLETGGYITDISGIEDVKSYLSSAGGISVKANDSIGIEFEITAATVEVQLIQITINVIVPQKALLDLLEPY